MTECKGNELLIAQLGKISLKNKKLNDAVHDLGMRVFEEVKNTFCCVEVPAIQSTFFWWKMKTEKKIIRKKLEVTWFEADNESIHVVVKTAINRFGRGEEWNRSFVLHVKAKYDKDGNVETRTHGDVWLGYENMTVEEFTKKIVEEIADYILEFNRKHLKESV